MGLDSCDDVISILKRDLNTGSLTPTSLISTLNPSGNSINIDKVRRNALMYSAAQLCCLWVGGGGGYSGATSRKGSRGREPVASG